MLLWWLKVAKLGKDKMIMGIIGAIGVFWVLLILMGVISMCGSCVSTGPAEDAGQPEVQPAFNYSHKPADNIVLVGSFTERSVNDVRVYESTTGNVEIKFWGSGVAPNVTFTEDGNLLATSIWLDTLSGSGQNPAAAYIYLPAGPGYNITLVNNNGNVAFIPGMVLNGTTLDVEANRGEIVMIRNGFEQVSLNAGGEITAIFGSGNARYHSSKGNVSLGVATPSGKVVAEAPAGDINAVIIPGTNFTLNATSDTGNVACTIPLNYTINEKNRVAGSTAKDAEGAVVDLSSRGEITVRELQPQ